MLNKILPIVLSILLFTACSPKQQATQISTPTPNIPTATPILNSKPIDATPKVAEVSIKTPKPVTIDKSIKKIENIEPTPITTAESKPIEKKAQIVTVTILDENGNSILADTEVECKVGMSAFDALKLVTTGKVELKASGMGGFAYVQAIGKLKEFGKGPLSGWLYFVNGNKPDKGAGSYKLNVGDKVVWKYTVDGQK